MTDSLIQQMKAYNMQGSVSRLRCCEQSDSVLFCMKRTLNETNIVQTVLNKQWVWNLTHPTTKKKASESPI